jgi:hypothetical protein
MAQSWVKRQSGATRFLTVFFAYQPQVELLNKRLAKSICLSKNVSLCFGVIKVTSV